MAFVFFIFIAVVVIIIIWFIAIYNNLIRSRNQVQNSWSQIDVQLKRRHDLIPNLIETVKGYVKHEKGTLEEVVRLRNTAVNATNISTRVDAENALSGALSKLLVVVENYPDLKANQNFLSLDEELRSTENRIAFARQAYNDEVLQLNNYIDMFPSNIVAGMMNFKKMSFLEVTAEAERAVPKVEF